MAELAKFAQPQTFPPGSPLLREALVWTSFAVFKKLVRTKFLAQSRLGGGKATALFKMLVQRQLFLVLVSVLQAMSEAPYPRSELAELAKFAQP